MKAAIVVFPGSNRENDAKAALTQATGTTPIMVWHRDTALPKVDLVLVPGGFSYGDYLRCGAIAANSPVLREVKARAEQGMAVIGICNGFQIITEAGLLPGVLLRNANLKFVCRNVGLRVETSQLALHRRATRRARCSRSRWRITTATTSPIRARWMSWKRRTGSPSAIAAPEGRLDTNYNPNGSTRHIAGILNKKRNVLGLMPHPENAIEPLHGSTDGKALFHSLVETVS